MLLYKKKLCYACKWLATRKQMTSYNIHMNRQRRSKVLCVLKLSIWAWKFRYLSLLVNNTITILCGTGRPTHTLITMEHWPRIPGALGQISTVRALSTMTLCREVKGRARKSLDVVHMQTSQHALHEAVVTKTCIQITNEIYKSKFLKLNNNHLYYAINFNINYSLLSEQCTNYLNRPQECVAAGLCMFEKTMSVL